MSYEARLAELGIVLPGPFPPHDPLDAVVVHAGAARTSGSAPAKRGGGARRHRAPRRRADRPRRRRVRGPGARSTRSSLLRGHLGDLDAIERILTMTVFVACAPDFVEQPAVADGASRVLHEIFGDAGRHTRSAVGVAALPRGGAGGRSRSGRGRCARPR